MVYGYIAIVYVTYTIYLCCSFPHFLCQLYCELCMSMSCLSLFSNLVFQRHWWFDYSSNSSSLCFRLYSWCLWRHSCLDLVPLELFLGICYCITFRLSVSYYSTLLVVEAGLLVELLDGPVLLSLNVVNQLCYACSFVHSR